MTGSATLPAMGAEMVAACLVYAVVFILCGIGRSERRFYLAKAQELLQRRASIPVVEGA